MSIVSATIVPHSPLLIPEVAKDKIRLIEKTAAAYDKIATELKELNPDTIVIISPHGHKENKGFAINASPAVCTSFQEIGYLAPGMKYDNDLLLIQNIKEKLRPNFNFNLTSSKELDYASSIPLYRLAKDLPKIKIVSLSYSQADSAEHYAFGQQLGIICQKSRRKIAIIASGELSHRLKRNSPAGYSPKGARFDNKLIEYLSEPNSAAENILKMDDNLVKNAAECGLRSILVLLGIINKEKHTSQVLSYQNDLGIGYLVMRFALPGQAEKL